MNFLNMRQTKGMKKKNRSSTSCGPDGHYGPNAEQPDLSPCDLEEAMTKYFEKLKKRVTNKESQEILQQQTVGQHENQLWREVRKNILTASNFGVVIKRRLKLLPHNLIKRLLYQKELNTPAIRYGRLNESKAIAKYNEMTGREVKNCGIFIDWENPYLGASPDGLVEDDGLIEVKCLPSLLNHKIRDSSSNRTCFHIVDNEIRLKTNHSFYYQIQGQLNICRRNYCDFIIYSDNDFHIERINKDVRLWKDQMLPKLKQFYFELMLPEIVDGRITRGLKVRQCTYSPHLEEN
ncbi:hypothetical protein FQR65_LT15704 [Abscondita terminalis]|nr:hypothetical protein FQR65_LT15704 [Abscondita terminalis]